MSCVVWSVVLVCPVWSGVWCRCVFLVQLQNKAALEKFEADLLAVIGEHRHLHLSGCVFKHLPLPQ